MAPESALEPVEEDHEFILRRGLLCNLVRTRAHVRKNGGHLLCESRIDNSCTTSSSLRGIGYAELQKWPLVIPAGKGSTLVCSLDDFTKRRQRVEDDRSEDGETY